MTIAATKSPARAELTGVALAVSAALAFGTLAIFAKAAYRMGTGPVPMLAARFVIAAVLLGAYHRARGISISVNRKRALQLLALGGIGYAFESLLFFMALELAPAAIVGLIFYSYPLWTMLGSFALGLESFRWPLVAALGVGSCGVVLVFSVPRTGIAGPLLALAAALAVTIYFLAAQVLVRGVRPSVAATWTALGAAATLLPTSVAASQSFPLEALGPAFGLGLATAFAFIGLYEAVARIGSARAGVAMMLEPVTTVILAGLLLAESITLRIAAGTVLVASALPLLAWGGRQSSPAPRSDLA